MKASPPLPPPLQDFGALQQGVVALARGEPTPAPPSSAQRTLQQLAAEAEEDWPTGREADGERLTPVSLAAGSD